MADGLFGVPVGLRAYQDDQVKLGQLANQTNLVNAQVRNYDTDNAQKAAEFKLKVDQQADAKALQAKLAEIAAGDSGSGTPAAGDGAPVLGGGSPFDKLLSTGSKQVGYLLSVGRLAEAEKMLPHLTNGYKDLAQARQAAAAAKENEIDDVNKRHEAVAKYMSGATNQATYDAAVLQLRASGAMPEKDLTELPLKYNPILVKSILAGTAAAKQKADLEREELRSSTLNAGTRDEIENRKLLRKLEERKIELGEARETRLEKEGQARIRATGDKPLPPASIRELEVVRGELKRIGIKVGDAQADLVSDVAEQVKTLLDANPGLSRSEASARIVGEMQARGELESSMFGSKYKPKEGSVTMPLPTPKTAAELKKGYYYLDAEDGLTKLFDGKTFKVATKRRRTDAGGE